MPLRPLALAALLLLAPATGAAHATETAPPPAPAAGSPSAEPSAPPPAGDEPAGPPETDPADGSTAAPDPDAPPAPGGGGTPSDEQPSPAADGRAAPEPGAGRAEEGRAHEVGAEEILAEAAPGTPEDRTADAAELPALEHASFVGPGTTAALRPGSGALLRHEPVLREQLLPRRQQVSPGTLTRISLGTVTRVPAQDAAAGSSATGWVVGLSAVGAAAAAVVVRRHHRARRHPAGS
ncbi:hypothetical protein ACH9D2_13680 [Kocuria sp. M4R2S49]|uniref:hypothetical protein n=1 Tax=Kocuria rhizosphaericola TaxID=3376284 RepID=UPI00378EE83D